nr:hypothetical protein [Tanacetum cinerariifolium]
MMREWMPRQTKANKRMKNQIYQGLRNHQAIIENLERQFKCLKKTQHTKSLLHTKNTKPRHEFVYKPPSSQNKNDKGDVKLIEEEVIKPIPTVPNPKPINSNSLIVSPFLKDSIVHIPNTNAKTFADDVFSYHVGGEEFKSISGVGNGALTKKKKEKNDMGLPKEPSKEWKLNDKEVFSYDESKSRRVSERAFMTLFGQDNKTFTSTMFLYLGQLQNQLGKDEFQEDKSMAAFRVLNNPFQKVDSNTTPDSINMCHRGGEIDQDAEQDHVKSFLLKAEFLKMNDMVEKEVYNELSNRFLQLEKHCISLEISMQQKEESFQSNKPLVPQPPSPTPNLPPTKNDWDTVFCLLFDEYFNPLPCVVSPVSAAVPAPRAVDLAGSPSSTTIDQDVSSASTSLTIQEIQS